MNKLFGFLLCICSIGAIAQTRQTVTVPTGIANGVIPFRLSGVWVVRDTGTFFALYRAAINGRMKYSDSSNMLAAYRLALNSKQSLVTSGTTGQYIRGDGSLATFPTSNSSFSNGNGYLTTAVSNFSAGDLSPLFTTTEINTTTTPALSFTLNTAAAHKYFGNATGSTATPSFSSIVSADLPDLSGTYQITSARNASNGFVGKTLHKIDFENTAGTFNSGLGNANTAARLYTFQDRDGIIADQTSLHDSLDATTVYLSPSDFAGAGTSLDQIIVTKAYAINAQTGSYTGVLTDAGKLVTINNASANNFTVPTNASVAYPVGTVLTVISLGAGQTTIVAAGGVTINATGSALKLIGQYSKGTLIKISTNTWVLNGDITT